MTFSFKLGASGFSVVKDGRKILDPSLLPLAGVPDAKISITGQLVDFGEPTHDNAYWWIGSNAGSNPVNEGCGSFVTLVSGETTYTDILLGTVPANTDYLDVKVSNVSRTTSPNIGVLADSNDPVIKTGQVIYLDGGSCLLEECSAFVRGFEIVLSGTNVYLRRYQSIPQAPLGNGGLDQWSVTNNASDSGCFTYGSAKGPLVALIQYAAPQNYAGTTYTHKRGGSNQLSLSDPTTYRSVYSVDLEITPGRFRTSATLVAPTVKSAIWMAALTQFGSAFSSVTFGSVPIGNPDGSRQVLVAFTSAPASSSVNGASPSSVTIGGVSATKLVAANTTNGAIADIWMANVPTGTSASIVVTYPNSNNSELSMAVWSLYHLGSTTPVATATKGTSNSAMSLATSNGGFAFVAEEHANTPITGSNTLTGIGVIGYQPGNSLDYNHAVGFQPTDGTTLSIKAVWSLVGAICGVSLA